MLVFGHTGLTLATGLIAKGSLGKRGYLKGFLKSIDLRILLIGSLLPDIIDKPVGLILFARSIGYGRIFCHTLIFFVVTSVAGLLLYRNKKRPRLLTLAFGVGAHLILDAMWAYPWTLFYPFYGWNFPRENLASYLQLLVYELTNKPGTYVPEIMGFLIFTAFFARLAKNKKLLPFILKGET